MQNKSLERVLGLLIFLAGGTSFYCVHLWLKNLRLLKKQQRRQEDEREEEREEWRSFSTHQRPNQRKHQTETDDKKAKKKVLHWGCCHCQRFQFQIFAPEELQAVEYHSSCKLHFPRLVVDTKDFEVLTDDSSLSLYSVFEEKDQLGIFAFCSFCGMQVLYSPPQVSYLAEVIINANCLDRGSVKQLHVAYGGVRVFRSNHRLHHSIKSSHHQPTQQYDDYHKDPYSSHSRPADLPSSSASRESEATHTTSQALTLSSDMMSEECYVESDAELSRGLVVTDSGRASRLSTSNSNNPILNPNSRAAMHQFFSARKQSEEYSPHFPLSSTSDSHIANHHISRPAGGLSRASSAGNVNQVACSPSLYDTLPLMYSYASAASSPPEGQSQRQPMQDHHSPQSEVPMMIRGSELFDRHSLLGQAFHNRDYQDNYDSSDHQASRVSVASSSWSEESSSMTLHKRLKRYLQQHLNDEI